MDRLPENTQTLVWDLDGTLLDSFGIYEDIIQQLFPTHNLPMPPRELMLHNFHGRIQDSLGALLGENEVDFKQLLKDFFAIDDAYITDVDAHLFPDALQFSQRAHEHEMQQVIVTNRPHGERRNNGSPRGIVANSALAQTITQIICGDEVVECKPSPAALTGVDFDPATTVVIGDQFVDAQFAHNLGAKALWVYRQEGDVPHLDKMADGWKDHVTIVNSLQEVTL